jgi:hypothetical protein
VVNVQSARMPQCALGKMPRRWAGCFSAATSQIKMHASVGVALPSAEASWSGWPVVHVAV